MSRGEHRIVEWFGLGGTLKIIQFQTPCHGQGHLPLDQVAQSPVQPGLGHGDLSLNHGDLEKLHWFWLFQLASNTLGDTRVNLE